MRKHVSAELVCVAAGIAALLSGCLGEGPVPGVSRAPIVGGRLASAEEIHSTVAIVTTADGMTACTGTLIAPTVVITAAHCLVHEDETDWSVSPMSAEEIAVSVGLIDATWPDPSTLYPVASVTPHDGYPGEINWADPDALGREDDIGLIVLSRPVLELQPAPVPSMHEMTAALLPGATVLIEGYGVTNLRSDDGRSVLNIASTEFQRRSDHEMLAGRDGMPDTCYGDSGGPAYLEVAGSLAVVGVTSRAAGSSLLECGGGGIYTLAPAYDAWIRERSGGAYPPLVAPPGSDEELDTETDLDPETEPSDPLPAGTDEPEGLPADPAETAPGTGEMAYYYGGCSAAATRPRASVVRRLGALL